MHDHSRRQQWQTTAGPRLRAAAGGVQPLGLRLASSANSATRGGITRLPPGLQRRLGISRPDETLRRGRQTAAALAGALIAAAAATEGNRRGRELQQLADGLAQLRLDVRELGGRRARERERQRRRRQLAAGLAIGLAGLAGATALAQRRRRRPTAPPPIHEPEESAVPAGDLGGEETN